MIIICAKLRKLSVQGEWTTQKLDVKPEKRECYLLIWIKKRNFAPI